MEFLVKHPAYLRAKAHLISMGLKYEWLTSTVDLNNPITYFFKNGRQGYRSTCPHYEGYWLCGGFGSPKCRLSDPPRPMLYYDTFCSKDHQQCPHWIQHEQARKELSNE